MKTTQGHLKTNNKIKPFETLKLNVLFIYIEDDYFQQIFGTAMGTPMAPSAANLFMGWLEAQLLASSPVSVSQDTWKRFIDDIFLLWMGTPEDLDVFFEHINSFHTTSKFTIASTDQLPFLDILISLKESFLKMDIHTKPTGSHAYLPSSSCHSHQVVKNIPYSQFLRLQQLCADTKVFNAHCDEMEGRFLHWGHHLKNVQEARARASNTPHSEMLQYKPKQSPSLSHTTHPILRSAAGSQNSKPLSYTPAGECSRRSPTFP